MQLTDAAIILAVCVILIGPLRLTWMVLFSAEKARHRREVYRISVSIGVVQPITYLILYAVSIVLFWKSWK